MRSLLASLTLFCLSLFAAAQSKTPGPNDYVANQVVLKLKDSYILSGKSFAQGRIGVNSALDQFLSQKGIKEVSRVFGEEGFVVRTARKKGEDKKFENILQLTFAPTTNDIEALVAKLKTFSEVEFAEPNYYFSVSETFKGEAEKTTAFEKGEKFSPAGVTPNDPLYSQQANLVSTNVTKAWEITKGDSSVVIAVLDTGVDWEHPDLQGNIWLNKAEVEGRSGVDDDGNGLIDDVRGWDWINNDNNPTDDNSHGTHVAGIAAARGDNGIGISGVNWYGKVMCLKVLQSTGRGDAVTIARGIDYAAAKGAQILNLSLGSYYESLAMKVALERAYATSFIVAAAGNDGTCIGPGFYKGLLCSPLYPGAYSFVLGVQDQAIYSNFDQDGPFISKYSDLKNYDVYAPGTGIASLVPKGGYKSYTGTSMATPLVAGVASLYISQNKDYDKEFLFGHLINTSSSSVDAYRLLIDPGKPNLTISKYELLDTCATCDGDGRPDAGESINLKLHIKNTWTKGDSISVKLLYEELADTTLVQFVSDSAFAGAISPNATGFTLTPTNVKIADHVFHGADYKINVRISDTKGNYWNREVVFTFENAITFGGILTQDVTLFPNKKYVVTDNLVVSDCKLTLKPGATLTFDQGRSLKVLGSGRIEAIGTSDSIITFTSNSVWSGLMTNAESYFKYCVIENISLNSWGGGNINGGHFNLCVFRNNYCSEFNLGRNSDFSQVNIINNKYFSGNTAAFYGNHINILNNYSIYSPPQVTGLLPSNWSYKLNIFNNSNGDLIAGGGESYRMPRTLFFGTESGLQIQKQLWDYFDDPQQAVMLELDSALKTPWSESPGIVWKVDLDGKTLCSYNGLPEDILEIGEHELKVWFNRAMDTTITPLITFGQRHPFNQVPVKEKGVWSEDKKSYTVKRTFTVTDPNGLMTFSITDAKDDMGMVIPDERVRFRVNLQSSGSKSLNFGATSLCGKIALEWDNLRTTGSDIIGYNIYRRTRLGNNQYSGYSLMNKELVLDNQYTDYKVSLDTTYEYVYTAVRGGMGNETDSSYFVSGSPLRSRLADANGDSTVNVLDVVTTVNHILLRDPQPFIFPQADMNNDKGINVLDVIGIIDRVLNPTVGSITGGYDYNSTLEAGEVYLYQSGDTIWARSTLPIAGIETAEDGVRSWLGDITQWEQLRSTGGHSGNWLVYGFNRQLKREEDVAIAVVSKTVAPDQWLFSTPDGRPLKAYWMGVAAKDRRSVSETVKLSALYPNPSKDNVRCTIEASGVMEQVTLDVYDGKGSRVFSQAKGTLSGGVHLAELDLGELPKASYRVVLSWTESGARKQEIKTIVLQ
jgi:subtilisin family serine protease